MLRGRRVNKGFGREFSKKCYIFGQNTDVQMSGNQRVRADAKDGRGEGLLTTFAFGCG